MKIYCERCNKILDESKITWLELSNTDNKYYLKIPKNHISQGCFAFGKACANAVLKNNGILEIIYEY